MITYEWTIKNLKRETEKGGVIEAHWVVIAQEGEYKATTYGSQGFTPEPDSPNFIPFEQLSEDDVLEWLWALEDFDKEEIEENLANKIEERKNPKTVFEVPWTEEKNSNDDIIE